MSTKSMKFLLDLVPCFGSFPDSQTRPPPHDDNARSLMSPPPPHPQRIRRTVRTPSWSPSLCAISEDRAVMKKTTGGGPVISQRKVMASTGSFTGGNARDTSRGRGPGSASRTKAPPYKVESGYGRGYLSGTMIPAFSPAPFVF
ncbi:hypothetical protein MLD38_002265 [Melastoma candidum]|uniref:Uncharacterized protein n=1 Tax=Melastoma candidum TaxID=119954 RepID=A0ACB9SFZ8_9MYRT|nr:hypothetical protein MLD38_002265 [Melastoma candidum]